MSQSSHLEGKVALCSLPVYPDATASGLPDLKRLALPQGELAQVHNSDQPVRYLAVIELREGTVRGNHYHRVKRESVYLIDGEVALELEDLATGRRESVTLVPGDLVFIPPGIAHALRVVRPGRAIEFAPDPLDPADSFRHVLV